MALLRQCLFELRARRDALCAAAPSRNVPGIDRDRDSLDSFTSADASMNLRGRVRDEDAGAARCPDEGVVVRPALR